MASKKHQITAAQRKRLEAMLGVPYATLKIRSDGAIRFTAAQRAQLVQAYDAGNQHEADFADSLGISRTAFNSWRMQALDSPTQEGADRRLFELTGTRRPPKGHHWPEQDAIAIVTAINTLAQPAATTMRQCGLNPALITQWRKRYGLPNRDPESARVTPPPPSVSEGNQPRQMDLEEKTHSTGLPMVTKASRMRSNGRSDSGQGEDSGVLFLGGSKASQRVAAPTVKDAIALLRVFESAGVEGHVAIAIYQGDKK